jgi:hypothetical protein
MGTKPAGQIIMVFNDHTAAGYTTFEQFRNGHYSTTLCLTSGDRVMINHGSTATAWNGTFDHFISFALLLIDTVSMTIKH